MTTEKPDTFSFPCAHCGKRLRAPDKLVGRKVKCPGCSTTVQVPQRSEAQPSNSAPPAASGRSTSSAKPDGSAGTPPAPAKRKTSLLEQEDPFSLLAPAISDLDERQQAADEVRAEKERQRDEKKFRVSKKERPGAVEPVRPVAGANKPTPDDSSPIPFDSEPDPEPVAQPSRNTSPHNATVPKATAPNEKGADSEPLTSESAPSALESKSVFDEDLPDLDDLRLEEPVEVAPKALPPMNAPNVLKGQTRAGKNPNTPGAKRPPPAPPKPVFAADGLDDLDDMIPDIDAQLPAEPFDEDEIREERDYRVVCNTCGTAQYVAPSAAGMKIKCPDCFSSFKAPPPPKDQPKKKSRTQTKISSRDDLALSTVEASSVDSSAQANRSRTESLLEKAKIASDEDESESQYDTDFDTSSFLQRTLGFFKDPITMAQVVIYGSVFGMLFACSQFALNDTQTQFGKGMLLLIAIGVPVIAILFALPMLSGGLALIEAVANKQARVREIPAFNIFDNAADLLVIAFALAAAIVPGYFVGSLVAMGGEYGGWYFRMVGMMLTSVALFPVFLLSMLDNGSLFQPISSSVLKSLTSASEAWGGYYMKTLIATFVVILLWFILLGGNVLLAGIGGFLLPLLIYFTCQQIGALADSISDHLSFDFVPDNTEEADEGDELED